MQKEWAIRITHIATNISATRTSEQFNSEQKAKDSAIRYIRSRLVMLGNKPMREDELKFEII